MFAEVVVVLFVPSGLRQSCVTFLDWVMTPETVRPK
jgi:hypothetical protein